MKTQLHSTVRIDGQPVRYGNGLVHQRLHDPDPHWATCFHGLISPQSIDRPENSQYEAVRIFHEHVVEGY
jgi:hypothetical protein